MNVIHNRKIINTWTEIKLGVEYTVQNFTQKLLVSFTNNYKEKTSNTELNKKRLT